MDTLGRALAGYPFANSYLFSMILDSESLGGEEWFFIRSRALASGARKRQNECDIANGLYAGLHVIRRVPLNVQRQFRKMANQAPSQ